MTKSIARSRSSLVIRRSLVGNVTKIIIATIVFVWKILVLSNFTEELQTESLPQSLPCALQFASGFAARDPARVGHLHPKRSAAHLLLRHQGMTEFLRATARWFSLPEPAYARRATDWMLKALNY